MVDVFGMIRKNAKSHPPGYPFAIGTNPSRNRGGCGGFLRRWRLAILLTTFRALLSRLSDRARFTTCAAGARRGIRVSRCSGTAGGVSDWLAKMLTRTPDIAVGRQTTRTPK